MKLFKKKNFKNMKHIQLFYFLLLQKYIFKKYFNIVFSFFFLKKKKKNITLLKASFKHKIPKHKLYKNSSTLHILIKYDFVYENGLVIKFMLKNSIFNETSFNTLQLKSLKREFSSEIKMF